MAQETARDDITLKALFDAQKALIDEKAKLGIISTQERIAETRRAPKMPEVAAEKAALQEELKTKGLKPTQIKAINGEIEQIERQHVAAMQKLHFQEVEDAIKPWMLWLIKPRGKDIDHFTFAVQNFIMSWLSPEVTAVMEK